MHHIILKCVFSFRDSNIGLYCNVQDNGNMLTYWLGLYMLLRSRRSERHPPFPSSLLHSNLSRIKCHIHIFKLPCVKSYSMMNSVKTLSAVRIGIYSLCHFSNFFDFFSFSSCRLHVFFFIWKLEVNYH